MRILVCGSRNLENLDLAWNWLEDHARDLCAEALGKDSNALITQVIEGGARGADEAARCWARASGIQMLTFAPDWERYGRQAGPLRNAQMISEGRPDAVIAFPGGKGTADMVRKAGAAGLPVVEARI